MGQEENITFKIEQLGEICRDLGAFFQGENQTCRSVIAETNNLIAKKQAILKEIEMLEAEKISMRQSKESAFADIKADIMKMEAQARKNLVDSARDKETAAQELKAAKEYRQQSKREAERLIKVA